MKKALYYKVPFASSSITPLFSDLKAYAKVHPLILKAEIKGKNKYKITEKPFKYLPIRINYFATVNIRGNEIVYVISRIPLTKIEIKYNFLAADTNTTEIQCFISLDSRLIGKAILFSKLIKAQNELMKKLDKHFHV